MIIHDTIPLDYLGKLRPFRVASVQLRDPYSSGQLIFDPYGNILRWSNPEAEKARVALFRSVLDQIFLSCPSPDLIVFPEYSIPKSAHVPQLQEIADHHNCIIVPGSYSEPSKYIEYDDEKIERNESYKNNICNIYVPHRSSPVTISKLNLTGEESKYITSGSSRPNVAHLLWTDQDDKSASITIYLCRDFLSPYKAVPTGDDCKVAALERGLRPECDGILSQRGVQVDWNYSGLEVVVMNSSETKEFEGIAACDIRGLRGARKAVLLANGGCPKYKLGTTLIAPSYREKGGHHTDIVETLPTSSDGILYFEAELSSMFVEQITPDKTVTQPIQKQISYEIINTSGGGVGIVPSSRSNISLGSDRGVWHPAILGVLNRLLLIEFYTAKDIIHVEDLFSDKIAVPQIRNVYAGLVRGVHDVCVRRYVDDSKIRNADTVADAVPLHFRPFSNDMGARKFGEHFYLNDGEWPVLRVLISPRHILKYRGLPIPQDPKEWEIWEKRIRSNLMLPGSGTAMKCDYDKIKSVMLLAERYDLAESAGGLVDIRDSVFVGKEDLNVVIQAESDRNIREMYIFIAAKTGANHESDLFRREFVKGALMADPSVREIFDARDVHPIGGLFNYLIKVKCAAYEADDMLSKMRHWCKDNGVKFGSRTYEFSEHFQKQSIKGLENMILRPQLGAFQAILGRILNNENLPDGFARLGDRINPTSDQVISFSDALEKIYSVNKNVLVDAITEIENFYGYWYLSEFWDNGNQRQEMLKKALSANWIIAFHSYVSMAEAALRVHLKTESDDIKEAVNIMYPGYINEVAWDKMGGDAALWAPLVLFKLARTITENDDLLGRARDAQGHHARMKTIRNQCAHFGENYIRDIKKDYGLSDLEWKNRFDQKRSITDGMIEAFSVVYELSLCIRNQET